MMHGDVLAIQPVCIVRQPLQKSPFAAGFVTHISDIASHLNKLETE